MRLTISLFLLISQVFAQNTLQITSDSLQSILQLTSKEEKVDLLNKISSINYDLQKYSKSEEFLKKSFSLSGELNYTKGKIEALNTYSSVLAQIQKYDEALIYADSAENLSRKDNFSKGIADALRNKATVMNYEGENEEALNEINKSIEIFRRTNYLDGLASSLMTQGVIYTYLTQPKNAVDSHFEAAKYYLKAKDEYKAAHAYLNAASVMINYLGKYKEGLEYNLKSLRIFEKYKDDFKSAYCLITIGTVYEELSEYNKALEYYKSSLSYFQKGENKRIVAINLNYIGEVLKVTKRYNEAIEYYEKSLDLSRKINHLTGSAIALNNIGECYFELNKYKKSIQYFDKSLEVFDSLTDVQNKAEVLANKAESLIKLNKPNEAIVILEKAKRIALDLNAKDLLKKVYKNLSHAYKKTTQYDKALNSLEMYSVLKDSIYNEETRQQLAELKTKYELEKKEKEIKNLEQNKSIKDLELSKQNLYNTILFLIVLTLITVMIIIYQKFVYKKKAAAILEKQNKLITESEKSLKELNAAKDKMFSIVSHDIKGPFNSLIGMTEILSYDIEDLSREDVSELAGNINVSAKNIYGLAENLLAWSTSQLSGEYITKTEFCFNDIIEKNQKLFHETLLAKKIHLIVNVDDNIFVYADENMIDFVLRNLINNSIKFTPRGGRIKISVEVNDFVKVFVEDSGVGIPEDKQKLLFSIENNYKTYGTENEKGSGLGLVIVKDFIERNNGKIEIKSNVGKGTQISFTIEKVKLRVNRSEYQKSNPTDAKNKNL